ncbi:MAG: glycosyltransferase family 39 protein [Candidatus Limnocylindrales bacterium]
MRKPLLLFVLAVLVRVLLFLHFPDPAYPDSYYYVDVARRLAAGHGFSVDFIWIFVEVGAKLPAIPVLPVASNAHWMPLASIVQVPFIWLLGPTALASSLPFILLGALSAPMAWALARNAGAGERVALGAGLLTAIPVMATPFMAQPETLALYQPLVVGALWAGARGLRGHGRSFALAGALVGLATLTRSDGLLVGATLGLVFLVDRWRSWRSRGSRRPAIPLWAGLACAGLFLLVAGPWFARQLAVFGSLSPSTATGKVFFMRSFSEWDSLTTPATLDYFLGQGLGPLIASRVGGLVAAVTIFAVLIGGVILVPFMFVGGWLRRRSLDFSPAFAYAGILFAFNALLFAVHVPNGTFIRSAVGLAPHTYVLVLEGLAASVGWVAARRRGWDAEQATRFFSGAAVAFALIAAVAATVVTHAGWADSRADFQFVAAALDRAGAPLTDRVMSADASGMRYWSGRPGVVLVNDPLPTVEQVARAYQIRWLVLERAGAPQAVEPILDGAARPAWIGPPVASLPAVPAPGVAALPSGAVDLAVYPVCVAADDTRCAGGSAGLPTTSSLP